MKKEEVPQQGGLNAGCREVNYAVDAEGRYTLEQSDGWEAKTIALRQAWEVIGEQLSAVIAEVKAGRQSPLAYHMIKDQMDPGLLAQYSGLARWRVKRHLKPAVFIKLNRKVLAIYADLFGITIEDLCRLPDRSDLQLADFDPSKVAKK